MNGFLIGGLAVAVVLCAVLLIAWGRSSRNSDSAQTSHQNAPDSVAHTVYAASKVPQEVASKPMPPNASNDVAGEQWGKVPASIAKSQSVEFLASDDDSLRDAENQWAATIDWKMAPDTTKTIKPEPVIVYDSAKMPVNRESDSRSGSTWRGQRDDGKHARSGEADLLKPRYYGSAPPDLKYHTKHGVGPRVTRNDLRETVKNPDIRYASRNGAKVSDRFASGRFGEAGEAKTQRIVDEWAKTHHAVVRHGYFVNKQIKDSDVDHIIAFESDGVQHVLLLDSKNYASGIYDKDRRLLDRSQTWEPFIQSNSMELASKQLEVTLLGMPFRSKVLCYTVVWCSSAKGKVVLRGYEKSATIPINGEELPRLLGGFPDASAPNVGVIRALDWAFSPRGKVKKAWSLGMENAQREQQESARRRELQQGAGRQSQEANHRPAQEAGHRSDERKRTAQAGNAGSANRTAMAAPGHKTQSHKASARAVPAHKAISNEKPSLKHAGAGSSQRSNGKNGNKSSRSHEKGQETLSATQQVFGTFNDGLGAIPQFADGALNDAGDGSAAMDSRETLHRTKEFEKHTERMLRKVSAAPTSIDSTGLDSLGSDSPNPGLNQWDPSQTNLDVANPDTVNPDIPDPRLIGGKGSDGLSDADSQNAADSQ